MRENGVFGAARQDESFPSLGVAVPAAATRGNGGGGGAGEAADDSDDDDKWQRRSEARTLGGKCVCMRAPVVCACVSVHLFCVCVCACVSVHIDIIYKSVGMFLLK